MLVHKYGGSSLATTRHVRAVAERVGAAHRAGAQLIVVVSAQGNRTDELYRAATELAPSPPGRELDQLLATGETASAALMSMALWQHGVPAVALTGAHSGILATGPHGAGVIVAVDTEPAIRHARSGHVVVVPGFQGLNEAGDVITLGRGGSDTTAVAIAAELGAGRCEIHTDVDGVFTADPRVVPSAEVMPVVPVDVMMEMAFAGAKVMHSRAVEIAAMHDIDIHVRNSGSTAAGTVITGRNGGAMLESEAAVVAVVHDADRVRVTLRSIGPGEEIAAGVFQLLAKHSVPADVEMFPERSAAGSRVEMALGSADARRVRQAMTEFAHERRGRLEFDDSVGMVSVVGNGLLNRPEYTSRMLRALGANGISASSISTSQLKISLTIPAAEVVLATKTLHDEFELGGQRTKRQLARP
ncbi:aspartate kinase [Actinosynnema sp. ALI-1.44]|nr:aspartate kinase [Actinosynnema sp. ALI-1.44]